MKLVKADDSDDEVTRIRAVYDGYRDIAEKKWARSNPGNLAMVAERNTVLMDLLRGAGHWPPKEMRVLDVGCGGGDLLALFAENGAANSSLHGVDLLPARIEQARQRLPGANFSVANGAQLAFESASFDIITLFLVFSSVLSAEMTSNLAAEVQRLLKPDGALLVYDFRVPSPGNSQTRAVRRAEIRSLFSGCTIRARSLTVLPPLVRRLGRANAVLYPLLASMPFLRTHNLCLMRLRPTNAPDPS